MATNDLPWGDDNFVPVMGSKIYPLWHTWAKNQTWLGGNAEGRYIPKVGDYVEDTDFHITYLVLSLNEFYVPNLKRITPKVIAVDWVTTIDTSRYCIARIDVTATVNLQTVRGDRGVDVADKRIGCLSNQQIFRVLIGNHFRSNTFQVRNVEFIQ